LKGFLLGHITLWQGAKRVKIGRFVASSKPSKFWVVVLLIAAAFAAGYVGRGWWPPRDAAGLPVEVLARWLQEKPLHASTAAVGESFAMATGAIDQDVEGLYLLDFLTGDLQCVVLNFRTARFNAVFRTNVLNDLGIDPSKKPQYLMTTGAINFPRGASVARPGNSVVYVLETNTGNFAAYGLPWRRELAVTGRVQGSPLMLLDVGQARTAALREP
jgi:hypothetical protein